MKATTRTVSVELSFIGTGQVIRRGGCISGGVASPALAGKVAFLVHREVLEKDGLWNPVPGEDSFAGGLQVNIWADSEGYRELGRYFLSLAELDARQDPGFHEHHEGLQSADGRTRLHIICRKAPSQEWPPYGA
jgi:hypothetical protein